MMVLIQDTWESRHDTMKEVMKKAFPKGKHVIIQARDFEDTREAVIQYDYDLITLDSYGAGLDIIEFICRLAPEDRPAHVNLHGFHVGNLKAQQKRLEGLALSPEISLHQIGVESSGLIAALRSLEEENNAENEEEQQEAS